MSGAYYVLMGLTLTATSTIAAMTLALDHQRERLAQAGLIVLAVIAFSACWVAS
jgi:hypothetical protein